MGAAGGLPCWGEAFDLVAQMLEIAWTDAQTEHFLNHREEVCQGADRAERRGTGGPYHPARRRQDQGVFDRHQGHAAFMQLRCQKAIRAAVVPAVPGVRR